jgi:hypothetical protein
MENDGFILKLSANADQILAGTFLGATDVIAFDHGDDIPAAMALTSDETELVVVGRTESQGFPVTPGCLDNVNVTTYSPTDLKTRGSGGWISNQQPGGIHKGDGFVTVLSSDLTSMLSSTLIGGDYVEYLDDVLFNGQDMIVSGETHSGGRGFPLLDYPDEDDDEIGVYRAVVLRFAAGGTIDPDNPNSTPSATGSSGGGGGGGCFLTSLP